MGSIKPWELHPTIWKTQAAFLSYVRGGIRRSLWNKNPVKLEFIKRNRKRIQNPVVKNRTRFPEVWGAECHHCKKDFLLKDMEVDHKEGEHSLRCIADIQGFVEAIAFVDFEDLAFVCKPCHRAKSHAERQGISIEDAIREKQAIAIQKGDDKAWIISMGIHPAGNAKARREQIIEILKGVT